MQDRFSDEIVGRGPDVVFIPGLASARETLAGAASRDASRPTPRSTCSLADHHCRDSKLDLKG
jgi:hypothetical protein